MKALVFDKTLKLEELEIPKPLPGEVLIRVAKAGICNTDHEIVKGYVPGFQGVLGHEFFGYVEHAIEAFEASRRHDTLKVVLSP